MTISYLYLSLLSTFFFFFFNDTATTEIYTLSLHDALPISRRWDSGTSTNAARHAALWLLSMQPQENRFGRPTDRKSTRLNSSHTVISYAVFCLKKKKKKKNIKKYSNITITIYE